MMKKGCRVRLKGSLALGDQWGDLRAGMKGTYRGRVKNSNSLPMFAVELHRRYEGHDCDDLVKNRRGMFFFRSEIEVVE